MKREELLIEADELTQLIGNPNLRLFDATVLLMPQGDETGKSRYDEGHLPGAAFLDHAVLSKAQASPMFMLPDEAELAAAIGNLGVGNDNEVVVYATDSIMWATRAWWVLHYAGHRNVRVLNGGVGAWTGELETRENHYPPTTFTASLAPAMIADKDEVLQSIGNGAVCTLNALPRSFYIGEADVPYAKEGHITGSLSLSFEHMLDGNQVKADEALAAQFEGYDKDDRIITYCGGGIAATLTASCALLAGFSNVGVYDGSMSEWLAAGMPTTTGSEPGELS